VKWWFRQQLYVQILVAIVLGVALGLAFGDHVSLIEPFGIVFIRLLKMPILDVGNTCCNVSGDLVGTTLVASRFRMLDQEVFHHQNLHEKDGEITP
jgi:Na+/H+-dicarboxylate symporter